jgi:N-acetylmuramoyl-L-alanine amidase
MRRSFRILLALVLAVITTVSSVAYAEPLSDGSGEDSGDAEEPSQQGQTYRWDPFARFFRFFDLRADFLVKLENSATGSPEQEENHTDNAVLSQEMPEESILSLTEEEIAAATQVLAGRIIGLDPGHQAIPDFGLEAVSPGSEYTKFRQSEGCYGVRSKVPEYRINLLVALKLCALLENCGASVVMTRTDSDVSLSNIDRATMMGDRDAALWIRIHCNYSTNADQNGACVLIPSESITPGIYAYSLYLGECVGGTFAEATGAPGTNLVSLDNQTGFNWSDIPVIALEMGYLSNAQDDALLNSDAYQARCAIGIFNGIVKYFIGITPADASETPEPAEQPQENEQPNDPGDQQEPAEPVPGHGNGKE